MAKFSLPKNSKVKKGSVYGMVVGEHNRSNDLDVNVLKGKQLTNVRASGSDLRFIVSAFIPKVSAFFCLFLT